MKTVGIAGVTIIYIMQMIYLVIARDYPQALMLLGYSVANVGLILTL